MLPEKSTLDRGQPHPRGRPADNAFSDQNMSPVATTRAKSATKMPNLNPVPHLRRSRMRECGLGCQSLLGSPCGHFAAHLAWSGRLGSAAFNQNFAFSGVVGLAHDPLVLHPLHDGGGPVVANLEPALDIAGRCLAVA